MGSRREVGPPFQEPQECQVKASAPSGQEAGALSCLGRGALPERRREELDGEGLLSKSEFPFNSSALRRGEGCPFGLTVENPRLRELKWPPPASQLGRSDCQGSPPFQGASPCVRPPPRARASSSCWAKNGEQLVPVSCLALPLPSLSLPISCPSALP